MYYFLKLKMYLSILVFDSQFSSNMQSLPLLRVLLWIEMLHGRFELIPRDQIFSLLV